MGDLGSITGLGRSLGVGNGNPLQYSCLENFIVRAGRDSTMNVPGLMFSFIRLLRPHGLYPHGFLCPWNSGKNTGVGCHSLLQGIFLTQGWNPHLLCLLHWQATSLPLSHLGSSVQFSSSVVFDSCDPMDCVPPGCPWRFSRQEYWSGLLRPPPWESSQPRDRTQVFCIAGRFFTVRATKEAQEHWNG